MSPAMIPEEALLEELRRLATELQKTPSVTDMNRHGEYSQTPYIDRFGSWNEAVETAGLQPTKYQKITEKDLLEAYLNTWSDLNRQPTLEELNDISPYSQGTYLDRFETTENLKNKARAYKIGLYNVE